MNDAAVKQMMAPHAIGYNQAKARTLARPGFLRSLWGKAIAKWLSYAGQELLLRFSRSKSSANDLREMAGNEK